MVNPILKNFGKSDDIPLGPVVSFSLGANPPGLNPSFFLKGVNPGMGLYPILLVGFNQPYRVRD